ncbi:MAG TPA: tRNA 2-selenouridine(34) synthase MnmH, partial [Thiolinea sp.]|nr:tRNA 2-selenouridine(34) synthase MnmH [Thiolinea sp.]
LAIALLRQQDAGWQALLLEDESRDNGSVHLPPALLEAMHKAPLVVLDTPDAERLEISFQEYVLDMTAAYGAVSGSREAGLQAYGNYLLTSLGKIRKRLGEVRYQQVRGLMEQALAEQVRTGSPDHHRDWVAFILFDYYDPMYDYQLKGKQERIRFQGDAPAVRAYLAAQTPALG